MQNPHAWSLVLAGTMIIYLILLIKMITDLIIEFKDYFGVFSSSTLIGGGIIATMATSQLTMMIGLTLSLTVTPILVSSRLLAKLIEQEKHLCETHMGEYVYRTGIILLMGFPSLPALFVAIAHGLGVVMEEQLLDLPRIYTLIAIIVIAPAATMFGAASFHKKQHA